MLSKQYAIQWVGRCQYDTSDKLWGWFYYVPTNDEKPKDLNPRGNFLRSLEYCYVFWGATGKTLRFKRHPNLPYQMASLVRSKVDHKYNQITVSEFEQFWSNDIYDTINNKFVFHLLADDI